MWIAEFVRCWRESRIDEALSIKRNNLPKRIYKYWSGCPRDIDSLRNGTVWLSPPESYNDPCDCWLTMPHGVMEALVEKAVSDELAKVLELQSLTKAEVETYSTRAKDWARSVSSRILEWRGMMELCCFNTVGSCLLMWAHYAAHHKGFCIEYDLGPLSDDHPFRKDLYPVWYTDKLFDLAPYAKGLADPDRSNFNALYPMLGVLCKFAGWKYENEWRVVKVREFKTTGRSLSVPTPSRILLGARYDESAGADLLEICKTNKIPTYKMHLAHDKFELVPKQFVA